MTVEATLTFTVTEDDTAAAVGSGHACRCSARRGCWRGARRPPVAALEPTLADGTTSVGTRVELEHRAASPHRPSGSR